MKVAVPQVVADCELMFALLRPPVRSNGLYGIRLKVAGYARRAFLGGAVKDSYYEADC